MLASATLRRFCTKKAYFRETTHLQVYFCTKFQVSSIIQTSFREGSVILPSTAKWTPKKPTLIRVKLLRYFCKTSGKNLNYSLLFHEYSTFYLKFLFWFDSIAVAWMGVVTFYSIRDLRDSVPVHELSTCC